MSSCYVSGKEVSGNQFVDALDSAVRRARADVKNHRILIKDAVVFLANVNHFFTLLGKMFFTPYGKEFFTYLGKQIFTS